MQDPLDPNVGVGFELEGLEEISVPEPPLALLLASALAPLAWARREHRASR